MIKDILQKNLIGIIIIILVIISIAYVPTRVQPLGSGNDTYSFKNITSSDASATVPVVVRGGTGTLGSITVNTTHASVIGVYEGSATSTGTLIASIKASPAEQTFEYNIGVTQGIALDVPAGFTGNYTITYR